MSDWYEPRVNIRYDPTLHPSERRQVIRRYASLWPNMRTFIETGTADGATTLAVCDRFDKCYTIEVGEEIHNRYAPKLRSRGIVPLLGDSMNLLPGLMGDIDAPTLFWLDGHYCGDARGALETPVQKELEIILMSRHPNVILIDDARLFGNDSAYPSVDWVRNYATTRDIPYAFKYADDIMRITPR